MPKGYALGFLTGLNQSFEKQQEQRNKLQQIGYEQQAKAQYSPEEQARAKVLQLIGALRQPTPPIPEGGFSRNELEQPQLANVYRPVQAMADLQADVQNKPILNQIGLLSSVANRLDPVSSLLVQDYVNKQGNATAGGNVPFAVNIGRGGISLRDQTAQQAAQSEKSYEFHNKSIDQIQKPVDERLERLSRLQDTINQQTPQADALLAPELLTAMAGGSGSGLRMNEAEIARIVGGRTNLEGLKARLNRFNLDPTKGLSVTPAQRKQMRDLLMVVQDRLNRKSEVMNAARQQIIDAAGSQEHRKIIFQMRKALQDIDKGGSGMGGSSLSDDEEGLVSSLLGQ